MPTIPGLDSLQALAQAIADALNATLVSELKGIANSIADCCVQIADAATRLMIATGVLESISRTLEACKCQDIGEALKRELMVVDQAAFSLCKDNALPMRVFGADDDGNLRRAIVGEQLGTLIHAAKD